MHALVLIAALLGQLEEASGLSVTLKKVNAPVDPDTNDFLGFKESPLADVNVAFALVTPIALFFFKD